MKKKSKNRLFNDEPVGKLKVVTDFLPPPAKLAAMEEKVKITISLDRSSLDYFKKAAAKTGAKYQRMMREVLKGYAQHFSHIK